MKRLWRSVIILAICFAAVVGLRIYLSRQIEISKGSHHDAPAVETDLH